MSFTKAIHTTAINLIVWVAFPKWIMRLKKDWNEGLTAMDEIHKYMREMIDTRRNSLVKEERFDLFSGLMGANETEATGEGVETLSEEELLGMCPLIHAF